MTVLKDDPATLNEAFQYYLTSYSFLSFTHWYLFAGELLLLLSKLIDRGGGISTSREEEEDRIEWWWLLPYTFNGIGDGISKFFAENIRDEILGCYESTIITKRTDKTERNKGTSLFLLVYALSKIGNREILGIVLIDPLAPLLFRTGNQIRKLLEEGECLSRESMLG